MSDADDPQPTPLEYETPRRNSEWRVVVAVAVAVVSFAACWGVLTWTGLTAGSYYIAGPTLPTPPLSRWAVPAWIAAGFEAVAVVAAVVTWWGRPIVRGLGLGLLLGVGLALLLHGVCFVSSNF